MVRGASLLSRDENGAGGIRRRNKGDLRDLESRGSGKAIRDFRDGKKEIGGYSPKQSAENHTTSQETK